jgi:hypothetical protein
VLTLCNGWHWHKFGNASGLGGNVFMHPPKVLKGMVDPLKAFCMVLKMWRAPPEK